MFKKWTVKDILHIYGNAIALNISLCSCQQLSNDITLFQIILFF